MLGMTLFFVPTMLGLFVWNAKRNGANYVPSKGERWE